MLERSRPRSLADWGHTVVRGRHQRWQGRPDRARAVSGCRAETARTARSAVADGRLTAVIDSHDAGAWDVAFVCVGTPSGRGGQLDCGALRAVLDDIGWQLRDRDGYSVVAIRSTVLPHVLRQVVIPSLAAGAGEDPGSRYGLAVTPEFLREGSSVDDFMNPPFTLDRRDRLGVPATSIETLFGSLTCPIMRTGLGEAMMVKYRVECVSRAQGRVRERSRIDLRERGVDGLPVMETFCGDRS